MLQSDPRKQSAQDRMARQPAQKDQDLKRQLDLTLDQLDRLSNFYPRVEAKAAFMLAFNAGLVAIAISNVNLSAEYSLRVHGVFCLFCTLILLSYVELSVNLFPHLRSSIQKSHTYFGDIADLNCNQFVDSWIKLSEEQRLRDAAIQVWRNSEILATKFRACDRAIKLTMCGLVPWFFLLAGPLAANQLKTV